MIQFLQSIWLWSCAGIALPIIIHLWNVKQGKTLKVGNVALLTERARTHARSFRLSQILLLLVRCLLIIGLAFLASKPVWEHNTDLSLVKGWVLVDRAGFKTAYKQFSSTIDPLLKSDHSLHYFEKGFPEVDLATALKSNAKAVENNSTSWALLRELNDQLPATLPVHLFSANRLVQMAELRPAVALNLKWYSYANELKKTAWIEEAYETYDDSIAVIRGSSDTSKTYFEHHRVGHEGNELFNTDLDGGRTVVTLKDTTTKSAHRSAVVDTATHLMVVYAGGNNNTDAGYALAALRAIGDFTKRKIKTVLVNKPENIPAERSWLFWLSTEKLPLEFQKDNVFSYAAGTPLNVHTAAVLNEALRSASKEDHMIYKMVIHAGAQLSGSDWQNGYGEPLLGKDTANQYLFYSRFNPQWNNLVWSPEFPQLIYHLVQSAWTKPEVPDTLDRRSADELQLQPTIVKSETLLPKAKTVLKTSVSEYLWCVVVLLFLLERILTYASSKQTSNG